MFSMLALVFLVLCGKVSDIHSADFLSLMSTIANVVAGAGGALCSLRPCFNDEYIPRYAPRVNACRFAMMTIGLALTAKVANKED